VFIIEEKKQKPPKIKPIEKVITAKEPIAESPEVIQKEVEKKEERAEEKKVIEEKKGGEGAGSGCLYSSARRKG